MLNYYQVFDSNDLYQKKMEDHILGYSKKEGTSQDFI